MKEKLVATGSLDQVDVLAKQLYQKTVTNTSKRSQLPKRCLLNNGIGMSSWAEN